MDKYIARKIGDIVEDKVRGAFGIEDEDEDKDKGFFSKVFGRDDDEDEKKGKKRDKDDKERGFLSRIFDRDDDEDKWREKQKDKDDEDKGFFSKVFNRDDDDDDDDKWKEKKTGFAGLWREQGGPGAARGVPGEIVGGGEECGGVKGQGVEVNDGDLFNDLMNVAEETSTGK